MANLVPYWSWRHRCWWRIVSAAQAQHLYPLAGQAEYVDLLRAVQKLAGKDDKDARSLLEALRPYTLRKVRE